MMQQRERPASTASSFRMNGRIRAALEDGMRRDGVRPYGKSGWICRAIRQLFIDDPIFSKVGQGEDGQTFPLLSAITLDANAREIIDKAYRLLRSHDPHYPGVLAPLIRAAILHGAEKPFTDASELAAFERASQEASKRFAALLEDFF